MAASQVFDIIFQHLPLAELYLMREVTKWMRKLIDNGRYICHFPRNHPGHSYRFTCGKCEERPPCSHVAVIERRVARENFTVANLAYLPSFTPLYHVPLHSFFHNIFYCASDIELLKQLLTRKAKVLHRNLQQYATNNKLNRKRTHSCIQK